MNLPDYAPVPRSAFGPAVNEQGYHVGLIERNLYWITDGDYQSAFLATRDGVVLFDAPPSIGHNIRRAVDEVTAAIGTPREITHLVYTHHHSDHAGGSSIFGKDIARIGHEETRRLLLRDNDPKKPPPEETFQDRRMIEVGGERFELSWHGGNHTPDNSFIHFPDHDALMLVDINMPGWVPFYGINISEDIPGYIAAPDLAFGYQWTTMITGHLGRLGTREDLGIHQRYIADIVDEAKRSLAEMDPTPFFAKYGENVWAGVKEWLYAVSEGAATRVAEKYVDVLGAADVFTFSNTMAILESMRLDLGYRMDVHP
ncbi:MBL fold metallo-hydrolase [Nocardia tengchongensis]|uniref:MBL fold metallo-hydrolase n=1 Tax=Nocardia tengchongensis TaxID=2055889 RepID=UPI00369C74A4